MNQSSGTRGTGAGTTTSRSPQSKSAKSKQSRSKRASKKNSASRTNGATRTPSAEPATKTNDNGPAASASPKGASPVSVVSTPSEHPAVVASAPELTSKPALDSTDLSKAPPADDPDQPKAVEKAPEPEQAASTTSVSEPEPLTQPPVPKADSAASVAEAAPQQVEEPAPVREPTSPTPAVDTAATVSDATPDTPAAEQVSPAEPLAPRVPSPDPNTEHTTDVSQTKEERAPVKEESATPAAEEALNSDKPSTTPHVEGVSETKVNEETTPNATEVNESPSTTDASKPITDPAPESKPSEPEARAEDTPAPPPASEYLDLEEAKKSTEPAAKSTSTAAETESPAEPTTADTAPVKEDFNPAPAQESNAVETPPDEPSPVVTEPAIVAQPATETVTPTPVPQEDLPADTAKPEMPSKTLSTEPTTAEVIKSTLPVDAENDGKPVTATKPVESDTDVTGQNGVTSVQEATAKLEKKVAESAAEKAAEDKLASEKETISAARSTANEPEKTPFKWSATPAQSVQVTGSFNGWTDRVDLTKQDDGSFTGDIAMAKGKHMFKFIVDGEWLYDITLPSEADESGNVNNVIEI